jgi:hypothetical protein
MFLVYFVDLYPGGPAVAQLDPPGPGEALRATLRFKTEDEAVRFVNDHNNKAAICVIGSSGEIPGGAKIPRARRRVRRNS